MSEETRITLRLPNDLHGDIVALTERYKTSLNGQIIIMLRDWFTSEHRFSELEQRIASIENRMTPVPPTVTEIKRTQP